MKFVCFISWQYHGAWNYNPSSWKTKIFRIMYGLPWITTWCHEWGDPAMKIIAESPHELYTVTQILLFYFLHAILYHQHTNPLKTMLSSIAPFAIVTKDGLFSLSIVTSPQLICDVRRPGGTGIGRHIVLLFLNAQICAKLIFTSK